MDSDVMNHLYGDYRALHQRRFDDTLALLMRHQRGGGTGGRGKLLDVGIFPGFMAAMAKQQGYAIWGIANEEMTPEFRDYAEAHAFTLAQLDVETDPFPFEDAFFDVVICTEIIEHMHRNPFALLEKCYRVLKPGGIVIVSTPNLARQPVRHALRQGLSYMPAMDGPLDESFPVNPCYTHRREYTMSEIVCMCCAQDKYLFRYVEVERFFSDCWDAGLRARLAGLRDPRRMISQGLTWLTLKWQPQQRSCLMFLARKPQVSFPIPADRYRDVEGLHPVEHDTDTASMARRALPAPFRWTTGTASFGVPVPASDCRDDLRFLLQYAYVTPGGAPEGRVRFSIDGALVHEAPLASGKAYRVATLPIPAIARQRGIFTVQIESDTWKPGAFGFPDDRELGVMISWGDALIVSEK